MIIENKKEQAKIHIDLNLNPGASISLPPEVSTQVNPCFQDVLRRNLEI
jgi:D-lyxose ketol-isomerase